jgi:hypothetical protein
LKSNDQGFLIPVSWPIQLSRSQQGHVCLAFHQHSSTCPKIKRYVRPADTGAKTVYIVLVKKKILHSIVTSHASCTIFLPW